MRIVICNCQNWFKLDEAILSKNMVLTLSQKQDLTLELLDTFKPELIFFPHWHWLVPEEIFTSYKCIVFHTAPLPYGRGGSPIQNLILRGHKNTPVCALLMSDGIDSGPIFDTQEINLHGRLSEIFERLNASVNQLMSRLIEKLPDPQEQRGEVYTFKRLSEKDNILNLDSSIDEAYDKIRMLDHPSYPNAFLPLNKIRLDFYEVVRNDNSLDCRVLISKRDEG